MNNYNQLKIVLNDIFELNKADLDFGIYRIMNQKRKQVNEFIEKQLPDDIKKALSETQSSDKTEIENELKILKKNLEDAGIIAEETPKYKSLIERLKTIENSDSLEQEVFSHLANFFRRYYKDGDFISMRRYKKDVYAIPYEGEEVKLHWANHDQYYIKSSENFKNYTFKTSDDKLVHFQLKEGSTEQNNNKSQGNTERKFAIYSEFPIEQKDDELIINFIYEPFPKATKQESLINDALEILSEKVPGNFTSVFALSPTEKNAKRTLLEKHLNDFVSKNSFDYFIHKDLGGFLNRELDFYIKNEVLYLDDVNTKQTEFFVAQLSKVKAIKAVSQKIIEFLAQIENFQKKLWLKKKFVIRTDYCITLDNIPSEYYPEIIKNKEQLTEWRKLFDVEILKSEQLVFEPYLVLDTRYFDTTFKDKLISEIENLDYQLNGILFNSENFQALNLISEKFNGQIQTIYIDPPFNLDGSKDFLYSVNYKDSSWLSMLHGRVELSKTLLNKGSNYFVRCDVNGNYLVRSLLLNMFENFNNEIILKKANQQGAIPFRFNPSTESLFFFASENNKFNPLYKKRNVETKWIGMHSPKENTSSHEVSIDGKTYIAPKGRHWTFSQKRADELFKLNRIRVDANQEYNDVFGNKQIGMPQYLTSDEEVIDSNWTDIPGYSNSTGFSTENSEHLLERIVECSSDNNDYVLDYFLGSGTTAAVAFKKNRRFIGIEMGDYFYKYPLNRIKRIMGNLTVGTVKKEKYESSIIKYHLIESYEDTLNNLYLQNTVELDFNGKAKEEYLLQYMLEVESRNHLFNLEMFRKPFDYQLKVTENNELKPTKVDLVETFNYLIGLYVNKVQRVKDIKVVEGTTRSGIKTLVIWRDLETTTHDEVEKLLRRFYDSQRTKEFQQIYINGDHHLENLRSEGDQFKIKLIEETFFKKMFNEIEL